MSLFLLTNKRQKAEIAKETWLDLFRCAEIYELNNGLFLTFTNAYRKKKHFYKKYKNNSIFGFGTFFSENGFFDNAITSSIDLSRFTANTADDLYGHYIFVIESENKVRFVTDKIGLLNVFWTQKEDEIFVSNDLVLIAGVSENSRLSEIGVQQFVLNESCIGTNTIFEDINRVKNGYELIVTESMIEQNKIYDYRPEKLNFKEYVDRIKHYFSMVAKYEGEIAADMSAGYDTRLVASSAYKYIKNLMTITNRNQFDKGVDMATSPLVAQKLKLPIEIINNLIKWDINYGFLLHGFIVGRNVIRSKDWLSIIKEKYNKADLMLGGYGGEILRGKYNNYKDYKEFAYFYYKGKNVFKYLYKKNDYTTLLAKELKLLYPLNEGISNHQLGNWLYTMDRMRIWGGSPVTMMSLYGDVLHPFMDWYLINPIFMWNPKELKSAYLQKKITEYFSPGITKIPFNADSKNILLKELKNPHSIQLNLIKKYNKYYRYFKRKIGYRFIFEVKKKRERNNIYSIYPRENFSNDFLQKCNLNLNTLEKYGVPDNISRLATVQMAMERALELLGKSEN
ncbi:MAG: hypothetical protein KAT68_17205 [Bacteroidales bacterium]|nr:hypothetical protein [Bacteroidales bacterium]